MKVCMVGMMGIDLQGFLDDFVWTLYGLNISKLLIIFVFIFRYLFPLNSRTALQPMKTTGYRHTQQVCNSLVKVPFFTFLQANPKRLFRSTAQRSQLQLLQPFGMAFAKKRPLANSNKILLSLTIRQTVSLLTFITTLA